MRQLVPVPDDPATAAVAVDPVAAHASVVRVPPPDRPYVLANMVVSADGATTVAGRSGDLGGEADREVFRAIRAIPDVILVGAATVRAEGYGPPRTSPERQHERTARGQAPFPRLAVVTRSLDLDPTTTMFTEAAEPPLVMAPAGAAQRRPDLGAVAEIVEAGDTDVDLAAALAHLAGAGVGTVLCEGGPDVLGQLIAAGLLDELDVTVSPHLVAGRSARAAVAHQERFDALELAHLWEHEGVLFARYVRLA